MERTQVAIVGGGPAGYVAARRLGQLGVEAVLIERACLGGTCLNEGCIPTKALYAATAPLGRRDAFARMGVEVTAQADLPRMRAWLGEVTRNLRGGITTLLAAAKVEVVPGEAALIAGRLRVRTSNGERELAAEAIVLATGSSAIELPGFPFDGGRVWSSRDALQLPRVPERFLVIGGGVIGLELATVYRRLGSEVVVVEMLDRLLPGVGISRRGEALLRRALAGQGIGVRLGARAQRLTKAGVVIRTEAGEEELPAEAVLVAVGRRPRLGGLGLETVGIRSEKGFVVTDKDFSAAPGVFAIGDLRGGALLAHKASHEGLLLAERLAAELRSPSPPPPPSRGRAEGMVGEGWGEAKESVSQFLPLPRAGEGWGEGVIPQAIFTQPEVALVGLSPEEAAAQGIETRVGRCPLGALGRAWAEGEVEGHFQIVADRGGRVIGAEIVGPHASDLIAEATLAIQTGCTLQQLAETVHAHPTFPEGLWEAALAALGRPLHT
ncbi:MAG: FAD-dependent oxidoreductase [Candidatus Bipolaricaulota bacterium]